MVGYEFLHDAPKRPRKKPINVTMSLGERRKLLGASADRCWWVSNWDDRTVRFVMDVRAMMEAIGGARGHNLKGGER